MASLPQIQPHRKGGVGNLFSSSLFGSNSQNRNENQNFLLSFYETNSGNLAPLLKKLLIDLTEQRGWLNIWLRIDPNRRNRLTFPDFCNFFHLDSKIEWSRRIFDIINTKLTGVITFDEYLSFCLNYLILDSHAIKEFTFCLLSRRAATCDITTTVLDLQDMKFFIKFCYKIKKSHLDKVAMEIFTEMDNSGDFGIAFNEFETYSERNPTFLAFGNLFLTHFRLCWFGYDFWIQRSRQVKKSQMVGFGSFVRLKFANTESEEFAKTLMKRHGLNPNNLKLLKKKSSSTGEGSHRGEGKQDEGKESKKRGLTLPLAIPGLRKSPSSATATAAAVGAGGAVAGGVRVSVLERLSVLVKVKGRGKGGKAEEEPKVGVGPGGVISEEFYDEDDLHNTATVGGVRYEESDQQRAERLGLLQFHDRPFDFFRLTKLSFEKDFKDVVLTRKTTQQLKEENKIEKMTRQLLNESQTYLLLTTVLDDLMHFRRGKRIAFMRWLSAVKMEGTVESVYRTEASLAKIEEKKKMLKEEASDDGTGTWTEETGEGSRGTTGARGAGAGKPKTFIMTEEDEFKLHRRILEMTKKIHEGDAEEEAYSEFVREYNGRRHRNWFAQERVSPIIATRNQLLAIEMSSYSPPSSPLPF